MNLAREDWLTELEALKEKYLPTVKLCKGVPEANNPANYQ